MRDDAGYWIAWSKVSGVGAHRLRRLWECFGSMELAWHAPAQELLKAGLDQRTVQAAIADRLALDPKAEAERLARSGADFVTVADAHYPSLLRTVEGAPASLHLQGALGRPTRWPLRSSEAVLSQATASRSHFGSWATWCGTE